MANPFSIEPASPLQALMMGVQGYDRGRAAAREGEISTGRQEAMSALQSGADPSSALARLIGVGDIQGATVLAKLHEHQQAQNRVYGNVIYGQDDQGRTVLGSHNARGQFVPIPTPGFQPTLQTRTINTGTSIETIPGRGVFEGGQLTAPTRAPVRAGPPPGFAPPADDPTMEVHPRTVEAANAPAPAPNAPIQPRPVQTTTVRRPGSYPIDVQGREAAEQRGQIQGRAQANYPQIVSSATTSLRLLDEAISHPGRETATGLSSRLDPRNYIPGTNAVDFDARARQLEGRVFLDAFEQLRGGGAITEAEGNKATAAHARLMRSQSDEAYLAALRELRGIIAKGVRVARLKAAGRFDDADRELGLQIPDVEVTAPQQQSGAPPRPASGQTRTRVNWSIEP